MNFLFLAIVMFAAASPGSSDACLFDRDRSPSFDTAGCDAAISAETDAHEKARLLALRAYAKDDSGREDQYTSALTDLNLALQLDPEFAMARRERAYVENELGEFKQAEADLDAQAKLTPDEAKVCVERALSRFLQGNLEGALEDRDRATQMLPDNPSAWLGRADALMWLGRFDEAAQNLDKATGFAQRTDNKDLLDQIAEERADLVRWRTTDDAATAKRACDTAQTNEDFLKPALIGDCTRAFLDATTGAARADALTQRYTAIELWKQHRGAGLEDLRLAYAFDPENPDHQVNLGSLLVAVHRNHEGLKYLNMAISRKPSALAFATRAAGEYNLTDYDTAFQDAKKSFEMKPNELCLTVLGDLFYYVKHDAASAKLYWVGAYHLGDRDDGLKARLKDIGVSWPPPDEPAK